MINTQTYIIQIDANNDAPSPVLSLFGGIEWGMQTFSKVHVRLSYNTEWFYSNQRNAANMGSKLFYLCNKKSICYCKFMGVFTYSRCCALEKYSPLYPSTEENYNFIANKSGIRFG